MSWTEWFFNALTPKESRLITHSNGLAISMDAIRKAEGPSSAPRKANGQAGRASS
jgi:hypothetical protein